MSIYSKGFYADRRAQTAPAARAVLGLVPGGVASLRIADVGCGTGTWLAAGLDLGASTAIGYEGDWVTRDRLDDQRICFAPCDLDQPLTGPSVDLVLSLEVAEHLSPERAEGFVLDLVQMAPLVLFSAAIPGQGGVGHRTERWQSFWAGHFAAHDFLAYDVVRPAIWSDAAIPFWYRQNIVFYAPRSRGDALGLTPTPAGLLDRVHPLLWERANRELDYAGALPESVYLDTARK